MSNQIIHTAMHHKIENGKAVKTGVGISFGEGPIENEDIIRESEDLKYGTLFLTLIRDLLKTIHEQRMLKEHDQLTFLTGFKYLAGMQNRLQQIMLKAIKVSNDEQRVIQREQVDQIVYRMSRWERKDLHELYVECGYYATVLADWKVFVTFSGDDCYKGPNTQKLYNKVVQQVEPDFKAKLDAKKSKAPSIK